ncbi:MAG: cupin domain-containing protein [Methylacidiphilales bacterium]|nr:cupin domain-containing protein [Candidatus Methylacidiphilales bacterium]
MKRRLAGILLFAAATTVLLRADSGGSDYSGDVRVKVLLKTETNVAGQKIEYPPGPAEASVLLVEIPSGMQTGWHKHPVPLFGYVLAGEVTVTLADGRKHTFHEGDALAECVNILHNGVNEGKETTKLLIFVAGEKGVPFTVKQK